MNFFQRNKFQRKKQKHSAAQSKGFKMFAVQKYLIIVILILAGIYLTAFSQPKESYKVEIINLSDLEKIIQHTSTKLLQDIFITAFYSGMRLGEILNLVWDCIEFNRKIITIKNINGFVTKSKKERVIPMNDR